MRKLHILAIIVFLVAVGVLFALNPRNTAKVQSGVLTVVTPFLKAGSSAQQQVNTFREGMKTLEQLERENNVLKTQNKELAAINQTLRGLEGENNKLRTALEYKQRSVFRLIPARVITRDAATWWNSVMIDKGSNDGLEPDMPVLTEAGLVGKTTTVSPDMTMVLLISDENCKVAASVEGTREQGIVKGERLSTMATPEVGLSFLSKLANLTKGQKVYTSGVGGVYPSGLLIGVVDQFKVRPLDGYASLIPAVDLANLEDVFVVAGKKK